MYNEFKSHHSIAIKSEDKFDTIIKTESPIVCLSDIHGDIDALITCLRDCASVIKKTSTNLEDIRDPDLEKYLPLNLNDTKEYVDDLNYKWIGGKTIVVIVGDILDTVREDHHKKKIFNSEHVYPQVEIKILRFLNKLKIAARNQGGNIIKLCGNHELGNFMEIDSGLNITNYMSDSDRDAKNYYDGYNRADYFKFNNPGFKLYQEGGIGFGVLINNNFFVHGGLNSKYTIEDFISVNTIINRDREKELKEYKDKKTRNSTNNTEPIKSGEYFKNIEFIKKYDEKMIIEKNKLSYLTSGSSPLWTRKFNYDKDIPINIEKEPDNTFNIYNFITGLFKKKAEVKQEKQENILNYYFNVLFKNNIYKKYNIDDYRLIIGHSGQNASLLEFNNATLSHIETSNKKIIKFSNKTIYEGHGDFDKDLLFGISVACIQDLKDKGLKNPRLIRVDYGVSRGFDILPNAISKYCKNQEELKNNIKNIIKILYTSRTPQVCIIDNDNMFIVKSTLKNTKINVPRQLFSGTDKDHKSKIYQIIIDHTKHIPNCEITEDTIDSMLNSESKDSAYYEKYLKYKNKYMKLKSIK
jgi:hypothetical protein